jgi:hypothetical protein
MANTTIRTLTPILGSAVVDSDLFVIHSYSVNTEYNLPVSSLRFVISNGAIAFANTVSVTGLTTLSTANVTSNANVGGTLGVAGLTTLSTANISGAAKVGGTLNVTGLTTLATANIASANVSGTFNVTGAVTFTTPLTFANGGTGVTSAPAAFAQLLGYTSTATAAGTTTLTNTSTQYQLFTGSTTQTVVLPVTSTLSTGWTFHVVNNSTGNLTVNSSGGNLVATVYPNMTVMITCISIVGTTAAGWEYGYTDFGSVSGTGAVVLATSPTITGATLTTGVFNGTIGATTPSTIVGTTISGTTLTGTTSVLSSGSGGVGYSTGAGVAVTQLTSRTTAVPTTGAKTSGAITLFTAAAVVGTYFSFTVPNTGIAATDTVIVTVRGATNTYVAFVSAITAATSFQVTMASVAGTASDTPIVNFTIIKGVSA